MKLLAVAVVLAIAACGSAGQAPGAASQSRTTPAQSLRSPSANAKLFAIATGLPGAQLVSSYPLPDHATVKIIDANGRVYAEASFVPPPAPFLGNAAPLLQSPVRTVGGAIFYADSAGAVHRLTPDGTTSVIATFPLTNGQQELSYAVSPDGAHLIAIVLSTPPLHNPPPQTLSDPIFQEGGHWKLQLETADAGGSTTTTLQRDLGPAYPRPTQIVGWDKNGPLAALNSNLATQQGPLSAHLFGSPLIHIAADGTHLDSVGGPNCGAVDELSDGSVICTVSAPDQFEVRGSNGATPWQASFPSDSYYPGLLLAPDANAIAAQNLVITRTSVASAGRLNSDSSRQLIALGWLDANTVVVANYPSGQLSLYNAHGMVRIRDLGVSGIFEGLL